MPPSESIFAGRRPDSAVRIVSLVPSLTEAISVWGGLGELVGRTRYCTEPVGAIEAVEVVGGTKNPELTRIVELRPDLVVMNREENRREDYDALVGAGIRAFVTHPRTVAEAAEMLAELGKSVGRAEPAAELAERCRAALAAAVVAKRESPPVPTFCPIWRNPWMTFCAATYIGDMLDVAGLENVFASAGDADFFVVELAEVARRRPSLVLLPDEPYPFSVRHARELAEQGIDARFELVCGKDLAWYGPRIPGAIERLASLVVPLRSASA
jgi:ABC-type Fe3+-hydroxamate transport system substrate-binding protein